jgi:hypothetical protein
MTLDFTWNPGTVMGMNGREKLKVGQRWSFIRRESTSPVLLLAVISTSADGSVVLRPEDPQLAEQFFPEVETVFKGTPTRTREGCPFKWVDDSAAKGSKGQYKPGDLLVHEAWSVWSDMRLHPDFAVEKV